ncbi:MAG: hypothetical protein P1U70_03695 [Saprospiraceae bacterium]|nr:hypothetical protein [Saprospiraceae bacterium]
MKHKIIAIGLIFLSGLLNGQIKTDSFSLHYLDNIKEGKQVDLFFLCKEPSLNTYSAKDYLNIEWKEIQIINGQNKYYSVPGRFRISDHNFEFQLNNKTCELYPHFTKAVYQDEKVYVPFLTNFGEIEDYQFFQLLSFGGVNLLKVIRKNGNNSSSNLYFQSGNDEKAYPLKKKRKAVTALFQDRAKQIGQFVKEQDLSYSNTSDLIRIFDFYNKGS